LLNVLDGGDGGLGVMIFIGLIGEKGGEPGTNWITIILAF
jgi:hypothetical protein